MSASELRGAAHRVQYFLLIYKFTFKLKLFLHMSVIFLCLGIIRKILADKSKFSSLKYNL